MTAPRTPWNPDLARRLVENRAREQGAMLPLLHDLQAAFGYIHPDAIAMVAHALNVSRAETAGVVSFYHDFKTEPARGVVLKLCRAESCQAAGCEALVDRLATRHGLRIDAEDDEAITIETVYCLGHCAASPAALVDGRPLARLDASKLDAVISSLRSALQ